MVLTAKQEAFAQHYAVHRNGRAAYLHAYSPKETTSQSTISNEASRLLAHQEISRRIDELTNGSPESQSVIMTVQECFARWLNMAAANPDEITGLRVGSCRHCWGEAGRYHWREIEYLEALETWEKTQTGEMPDIAGGFGYLRRRAPNPDCVKCEGEGVTYQRAVDTSKLSDSARLIFGGVKPTRNGWEILLADRVKCLENASRIIGAFKDNVRLDGSLTTMAATVELAKSDPAAAAKAYQEMCAQIAVNK